jgi:hypothetical protein
LNLAKPVSDLKATRAANQVTLTWTNPTQTTDGAQFRHRGPTHVCQAVDLPKIDRCNAIATLDTSPTEKTATFSSEIPPQNAGANDYATYAVEVVNDRGRSAGPSNQVKIPTAVVSRLDGTHKIQITPDAVIATATVNPRGSGVQQTLELRRKEQNISQETTVAKRPLDLTPGESANIELRDDNFEWEKTYDYRILVVASASVAGGAPVVFEGDTSSPIQVFVHDIFPPAVPTGLEAVFSGQFPGQQPAIDLTWNPNMDRDLAGYFVYRRLQNDPATASAKLNAQPVPSPSYRDTAIQSGNTYVYSVSAVDLRGNESKRSEETSEKVPK